MIVGRVIGWFLLFCTLVLLGWDAVSSLSSGTWGFAVLGQRWYEIDQAFGGVSLNTLQAGIERNISVDLWDNVVAPVLLCESFSVGASYLTCVGSCSRTTFASARRYQPAR